MHSSPQNTEHSVNYLRDTPLGPDSSEITELLRRVPTDVDLIDVSPDDLDTDAAAGVLWRVLRSGRDGVGKTTTSKLLAAKRPRLIPIWDSFVEQATGLDTVDYWRKFQAVLVADDYALWRWLSDLPHHAPNVPAAISNLRILDVLLWMSVEQQR